MNNVKPVIILFAFLWFQPLNINVDHCVDDAVSFSVMTFQGGAQSTPCWLWICNLGQHTRFVIGAGVRAAHLTMDTNHEAVFKFTRTDATECVVKLACMRRGEFKIYVPTEPA